MKFGQRVRELRKERNLTQRELSELLDVSFTYISKVENERLHFGAFPSEKFIHKLAEVLDANEDELLILAEKVPAKIRERVIERPEAFHVLAGCNDSVLDDVVKYLESRKSKQLRKRTK